MKKILLAVLANLTLIATAFAGDPQAIIEAQNQKFMDALNAGSGSGVAALYAEDGAVLPPGGDMILGREGIAEFWQATLDSGVAAGRLTTDEVYKLNAKNIVEVGRYELLNADQASLGTGKYIVYWRKIESVWMLYRDIWN